jgi:hypothetical protein
MFFHYIRAPAAVSSLCTPASQDFRCICCPCTGLNPRARCAQVAAVDNLIPLHAIEDEFWRLVTRPSARDRIAASYGGDLRADEYRCVRVSYSSGTRFHACAPYSGPLHIRVQGHCTPALAHQCGYSQSRAASTPMLDIRWVTSKDGYEEGGYKIKEIAVDSLLALIGTHSFPLICWCLCGWPCALVSEHNSVPCAAPACPTYAYLACIV